MTYTPDYTIIQEVFTYSRILLQGWIIPLIVTFLSMLLITRDVEKWKILAFPIWAGWWIVGIRGTGLTNFIIFTITAILFVIEILSTQVIGNWIQPLKRRVKGAFDREYRVEQETSRMEKEIRAKKVAGKYLKYLQEKLNSDGSSK